MGRMGFGYGSEWHLLRYLGYHRETLNLAIGRTIGGEILNWLDFRFDKNEEHFDGEWKQLNFLSDELPAKRVWKETWPQRGNSQNWDAVGWARVDNQVELLLIEAKAHIGELNSACGAKEEGGRGNIKRILDDTKRAFGALGDPDWLDGYYQYCNRLATLYFLMRHSIATRLVFIYFTGDEASGKICPASENEWQPSLKAMKEKIGLTGNTELEKRIHNVFLPVCE